MRGAAFLALMLAACAAKPSPAEAPAPRAPVVVAAPAPVAPAAPATPATPAAPPPCVGEACVPPPVWALPSDTVPAPTAEQAPVPVLTLPAPAPAQPAPTPPVPSQSLPEAAGWCNWGWAWWLGGALGLVLLAGWAAQHWGRLPPMLPAVAFVAPTAPEAPSNPVPLLWTGGVVLAVAGALWILSRRHP